MPRRLFAEFVRRPEPAHPLPHSLDGVTDGDREVLTLVGRGLSTPEIAEQLHPSLATVKTYIGRLLAKLQARDRAQLVIVAYKTAPGHHTLGDDQRSQDWTGRVRQ